MTRKLKDYPEISLKPENLNIQADLTDVFGRKAPLHIEIGFGRTTFLLNQSMACPFFNFLGIESASKYYRHGVDRLGRWKVKNVKLIRAKAAEFIGRFLCPESVCCYHIYFPDPWPKRRHHKRRLFNEANLARLIDTLQIAGQIKIATDHTEYFRAICDVLYLRRERLRQVPFVAACGAADGECVGTNYERKFIKQQKPIYSIAVEKYNR